MPLSGDSDSTTTVSPSIAGKNRVSQAHQVRKGLPLMINRWAHSWFSDKPSNPMILSLEFLSVICRRNASALSKGIPKPSAIWAVISWVTGWPCPRVRHILIRSRELSSPKSGGMPASLRFFAISSIPRLSVFDSMVLKVCLNLFDESREIRLPRDPDASRPR